MVWGINGGGQTLRRGGWGEWRKHKQAELLVCTVCCCDSSAARGQAPGRGSADVAPSTGCQPEKNTNTHVVLLCLFWGFFYLLPRACPCRGRCVRTDWEVGESERDPRSFALMSSAQHSSHSNWQWNQGPLYKTVSTVTFRSRKGFSQVVSNRLWVTTHSFTSISTKHRPTICQKNEENSRMTWTEEVDYKKLTRKTLYWAIESFLVLQGGSFKPLLQAAALQNTMHH